MCLAVPGKLVEWIERDPLFAEAWVAFGGIRRRVNMACLPNSREGSYILVHAGIGISEVDEEEANRLSSLWQELVDDDETRG